MVDDPRALVQEAARRWRAQLIDLGGRNTLLYFRDLKAGTLDLGGADEVALDALLAGGTVPLKQLFRDRDAHTQATRRARTIRNKARELLEERGIQTCYLAVGMATWTRPGTATAGSAEAPTAAAPAAPVLLRSAVLRARGAAEDDFELSLAGETELNPTLVHLLAEDFGVAVDADQLEELAEPPLIYERLVKLAAGRVPGFKVLPRCVLGTFSYAKLPMVADLIAAQDVLARHEVIAAIAGDRAAQAALQTRRPESWEGPDTIAPHDEYLVLDADSSQNLAINAVLAEQHSVIKGPPGTGKSQTIANLISSLAAAGKRVLFVAEKRAAITAVTDRLARRGLGGLVMDVHDGTAARRKIAAELKSAFDSASRIPLPDLAVLHESLAAGREALRRHLEAMHRPREPWGIAVFDAQARLLGLAPHATGVRLRGPVLEGLDGATARRVRAELREFTELGGFVLAGGWVGAVLDGPAAAQAAFGAVEDLVTRLLPAARAATQRLAAETGLPPAAGLEQWRQRFQLVASVQQTLAVFRPEVFADDLPALLAALAPDAGLFGSAGFFRGRPLRKRAAALWIGRGQPGRGLLREGLTAALAARDAWGSTPVVPAGFDRDRGAFEECYRAVAGLAEVVPGLRLLELDLDRLASTLAALAADERTLRRVPRLNELAAGFDRLGLAPLLGDLRARRPAPETAGDVFEACWLASVLQHVAFVDPQVGTFDGVAHDRLVEEYERLDRRHLDATAARVLRAVAEHVVEVRDAYPDESRLVEHQANLKRRHLPVRQLFAAAPHVLTALKPCWAMSPLVVSQLLPADGQYFDVVVFDEASQVTPADAVPALLRAKQVVVAGDEHQLPPTAFFTAADAAAEEPLGVTADGAIDLALTSGYESILDVLTALLPGYLLRWHYRSQDERLIAFSNAHIYDGSLVTFPGTAGASVLTHVLVDDGEAEADRVVRLILQHAALRPNESLGVIAMGIEHAERIDLALRTALAARPELHPFFAERAAEPFFVKNLERVQGDERDAIILSVGYGRTADGRLLHRFGPLLLEGGERRLNVAITRARRRMTVVSSFAAADLDPARSTAEGVRLLRAFLAYAQSGGNALEQAPPPALNPFEADVRDRLLAAGLPVTPQYGVAGYFIDFAAAHPSLPDEMVLAIETDGFTYHSSTTVRDRDRLRQEQLERLGWRFHRIWSTDWLQDADREVERVCAAYDEAVAAVDAKRSDEPTVVLSYPAPEPAAGEAGPSRDAERPVIEPGRPITGYAPEDLVALVRWIESDTLLRTEDELIEEARRELGFKRGGTRINAALAAAVVSARSAGTAVPDHR